MADQEKPNTRTSVRQVYRLNQDCGRMGVVEALFTAHPEDIKAIMGEEIYFGEILGKHSEIYFPMTTENLEQISAPDGVVRWLERELGHEIRCRWTPFDSWTISGYNPLDCLREEWIDGFLAGSVNES